MWDHRVIEKTDDQGNKYYSIHEIYYNADGSVYLYNDNPVRLQGDTVEDLQELITWIRESLQQPVLKEKDLKNG